VVSGSARVVGRGKEISLKDVDKNRYQGDKPTKNIVEVGERKRRGRTRLRDR
jgi:hypothetical protein